MGKKISVYDFLYVDATRIRSLISQLHASGVPIDLEETNKVEGELSGSGDVAGKIGVGDWKLLEANAEGSGKLSGSLETKRRFDVQYTLPMSLLRLLTDQDIINREPREWRFGTIALFTGQVHLADISSVHGSWDAILEAGSGLEGSALVEAKALLGNMPPSVHGIFHKNSAKVWCNLLRENWVTPPSGITLSHGSHVAGDWSVLGTVDALASENVDKDYQPPVSGALYDVFRKVADGLREMMGRPDGCFGLSPLLVFRQVTRKS
ncbi:MAG: hypothetical protein ABL957_07325 [Parvularculaceae bacterium]